NASARCLRVKIERDPQVSNAIDTHRQHGMIRRAAIPWLPSEHACRIGNENGVVGRAAPGTGKLLGFLRAAWTAALAIRTTPHRGVGRLRPGRRCLPCEARQHKHTRETTEP